MSPLPFFLLLVVATSANHELPPPTDLNTTDNTIAFRPSVAIIVGIFTVMFSLTFLLLMYAKFCHNNSTSTSTGRVFVSSESSPWDPLRTSSGIDTSLIASLLPSFPFSSLRGDRAGLECSVCLSKFLDADLLRLLPKCKHAFHSACIDTWLASHSTCPLCRRRIDPKDVSAGGSVDFLDLFVERGEAKSTYKFQHRIVASSKSRWSDLNSADLVSLDAEMMSGVSRAALLSPSSKRCMSEMTSVKRCEVEEIEEVKRVWMPIARRTLDWLARREHHDDYSKDRIVEP